MMRDLSRKMQKFFKMAQMKTVVLMGKLRVLLRNFSDTSKIRKNTEIDAKNRSFTGENSEKTVTKNGTLERAQASCVEPKKRDLIIPENYDEIIEILVKNEVLSKTEKKRVAAILSFDETKVGDLMIPYGEIEFLHEDDVLGPIMLDKLYKSGFTDFPVIDKTGRILGTLSTRLLNRLEIKEEILAKEVELDKVFYVRNDYSVANFLAAALRTRTNYFIVCDKFKRTVGVISLDLVLEWLLWRDLRKNLLRMGI